MRDRLLDAEVLRAHGAGDSLPSRLAALYRQQLAEWPLLEEGSRALAAMRRKELQAAGQSIHVQYNPARIVSSSADIAPEALKARPCFLCEQALPPEQRAIAVSGGLIALCNPRPIFRPHFTIAERAHTEQSMSGREAEFVALSHELGPDLALFFNGAKAGASAPDHFHYQAAPAADLPLAAEAAPDGEVAIVRRYGGAALLLRGRDEGRVAKRLASLLSAIRGLMPAGGDYLNLIGWCSDEHRILVVPRCAHRPACYNAPEDERFVISPAAVEVGGVLVAARETDYERLAPPVITEIFKEVLVPESVAAEIAARAAHE